MSFQSATEPDAPRWLLKALRETGHELESQLWGLDEEALRRRPSDDELSLKEIAAHLRDCEEHLVDVLELIAFQDAPRLPAFDADALVLDHDYRQCDVYEALERFEYLRHRTVNLLWSLPADAWERTGHDPYRGEVSIDRLVREQNEHDLEHLWQARRLREELERAAPSAL